jgi:hypothetical protein
VRLETPQAHHPLKVTLVGTVFQVLRITVAVAVAQVKQEIQMAMALVGTEPHHQLAVHR